MKKAQYLLIIFISVMACKKPYNPQAITTPGSYFVVEGVINSGSDSTIIKLSRTVNLLSQVTLNPVSGAAVTIESDQNSIFNLTQTTNGNYVSGGLNLDNTRKYRLRIKTANNQQYLSDFVPVKVTPPIDSIGFTIQNSASNTGIQIYVNTHDPNNNTRYYRWNYNETWQFHADYESYRISNGKQIEPRSVAQLIYNCFGNDTSSNIVLGSSAKLKQDVIYQNPILTIASVSEKIETKYSIQLHQYALTGDAYTFWQNLKKNTEQLGSIFDAQPSQINGNIHNTSNAAEPVIGYISVCTVQTKRIFISNTQLPPSWETIYPYDCQIDTNYFVNPANRANDVKLNLVPLPNSDIPLYPFFKGPDSLGYLSASIGCVDCTLRGTKIQPPFWR